MRSDVAADRYLSLKEQRLGGLLVSSGCTHATSCGAEGVCAAYGRVMGWALAGLAMVRSLFIIVGYFSSASLAACERLGSDSHLGEVMLFGQSVSFAI